MNEQKVFVYGTLRRGEGNYNIWKDAVLDVVTGCTVQGLIGYPGRHYGYPCVDFDGEGTVIGDLITVDADHESVEWVHRMERGAGYTMRPVQVTLPSGEVVEAIGYHWERQVHSPIVSGDWFVRDRQPARF